MTNNTIYIFLLLCLIGCNKNINQDLNPDPDCEVNPCDTSKLSDNFDTIWTTTIEGYLVYDLELFHNSVILNYQEDENAKVNSYNTDKGKLNWTWVSPNLDRYPSFHTSSKFNMGILLNRRDLASINLSDGSTKTLFKDEQGIPTNPLGQLIGDYYYRSQGKNDESEAWILRSHVNDLKNWEKVYTVKEDQVGGSKPNPQSYNLWIDPASQDEILVFQHRMAFPDRIDIEAWNITKQKSEWRYNDIAKHNNSNHQQIFILIDKAYFMAGATLYCFDIKSGEIVWEFDHPSGINSFMLHQFAYCKEEHLLIHKDGSSLLAFDPDDGELVYRNMSASDSDVSAGSPVCNKGTIYYTASLKLNAHEASTGNLIWGERSKLDWKSHFSGDIAIDEEKGIMYVADRQYLMAIKLQE